MLKYLNITETLFSVYMTVLISVCEEYNRLGGEYPIGDNLEVLNNIIIQDMDERVLQVLSQSLQTEKMEIPPGAAAEPPHSPERVRNPSKQPAAPKKSKKPPNPFVWYE